MHHLKHEARAKAEAVGEIFATRMVAKRLIGVRKPFKQLFFLPSERFFPVEGRCHKRWRGLFQQGNRGGGAYHWGRGCRSRGRRECFA